MIMWMILLTKSMMKLSMRRSEVYRMKNFPQMLLIQVIGKIDMILRDLLVANGLSTGLLTNAFSDVRLFLAI